MMYLSRWWNFCLFIHLIGLLSFGNWPQAQAADRVKSAYKMLEKGEFDKARALIDKNLEKEPNNAGAWYVLARYYLWEGNPALHLDSSYLAILQTAKFYPESDEKARKGWLEIGLDEQAIAQHRSQCEQMAFSKAQKLHTIEAYQAFIDRYTTAPQLPQALSVRNALAWNKAEFANTVEAYAAFMEAYPDAQQYAKAKERYDALVFAKATASGDLEAYRAFVKEHPNNEFSLEAYKAIFDYETFANTPIVYTNFISQNPQNPYINLAYDWLLAWYETNESLDAFAQAYPNYPDAARLKSLQEVDVLQYLPIFENKRYGYVDEHGKQRITPQYLSIPTDYLCESVATNYLLITDQNLQGVIDKMGKTIIPVMYDYVELLELGIFKVHLDGKDGLIHRNGLTLLNTEYDLIERFSAQLVKIKQRGLWGLATHSGRVVLPCKFEAVDMIGGNFVRVRNGQRYHILGYEALAKMMLQKNLQLELPYQHVALLSEDFARVRIDSGQVGAIDVYGKTIIAPQFVGVEQLGEAFFLTHEGKQKALWTRQGQAILPGQPIQEARAAGQLIAVKMDNKWGLLNDKGAMMFDFIYDDIRFLETLPLLSQGKQRWVLFAGAEALADLSNATDFSLIRGNYEGAKPYLMLTQNKRKALYSFDGTLLLKPLYDDITILDAEVLSVKMQQKVGLVTFDGQEVLPAKYQGISYMQPGFYGILANNRFGVFHRPTGTLIPPSYDRLLKPYPLNDSNYYFVAEKEDYYGLINAKNQVVLPFDFEEIKPWNAAFALVKNEEGLYVAQPLQASKDKNQVLESLLPTEGLSEIYLLRESPQERLLLGKGETDKGKAVYGVWSSVRGNIVPMQYDLVYNLGIKGNPVFFLQEYNAQRDEYTVIYQHYNGRQIWSRTMKEYDFKRLLCD
ncbi:WG repeat-containing protein [Eisenibacter elegans]|uniref:WG repeat-containing protein n=1 Tax=Eisenibacter elegans TaxID=997 RepID=UPI0004245568|nr:WG repeat-containing protein [Eisenibacter elegans]